MFFLTSNEVTACYVLSLKNEETTLDYSQNSFLRQTASIKTLVTPTNAQFYIYVVLLLLSFYMFRRYSPSSRSLHQITLKRTTLNSLNKHTLLCQFLKVWF
jgi:hypothetical protein